LEKQIENQETFLVLKRNKVIWRLKNLGEEDWSEEEGFGEECGEAIGCPYGCGEFCEDPQTRDANLCTTECSTYLCSVEAGADGGTETWVCTVCGCTDKQGCVTGKDLSGGLIETCHWVRKNLCSACANKPKEPTK
jgi:hypothetical protein